MANVEPIEYAFTANGVFDSFDGTNYVINTTANATFSSFANGVFINAQSILVGNSTVFNTLNSIAWTGTANNVTNVTAAFWGNSTVNVAVNSTSISVSNSTANVTVNSSVITIGNSTVNASINSTSATLPLASNTQANTGTSTTTLMTPQTTLVEINTFAHTTGAGYSNIIASGGSNQIVFSADAVCLFDGAGHVFTATSISFTITVFGSGANGVDTGTILTSTQYYYYVIYNPTTSTTAGLLSLSSTSPTMPSGYTFKRRVGWTYIGGTLTAFYQRNAQFTWATPTLIISGGSGLTSYSLATLCSPVASRIFGYIIQNNNTVQLNDNGNNPICVVASVAGGQCFFQWSFTPVPATYLIFYSSSSGGGAAYLTGWEDNI